MNSPQADLISPLRCGTEFQIGGGLFSGLDWGWEDSWKSETWVQKRHKESTTVVHTWHRVLGVGVGCTEEGRGRQAASGSSWASPLSPVNKLQVLWEIKPPSQKLKVASDEGKTPDIDFRPPQADTQSCTRMHTGEHTKHPRLHSIYPGGSQLLQIAWGFGITGWDASLACKMDLRTNWVQRELCDFR